MCVLSPPRKCLPPKHVLQSTRTPRKDATGQSVNLKYKKRVFADTSVTTTASTANMRTAAEGEDGLEFLRHKPPLSQFCFIYINNRIFCFVRYYHSCLFVFL